MSKFKIGEEVNIPARIIEIDEGTYRTTYRLKLKCYESFLVLEQNIEKLGIDELLTPYGKDFKYLENRIKKIEELFNVKI